MENIINNLQRFSKFYIDFHEKIFSVHVKCMQHLVAALPFQKLNRIDIAERLEQKKPILNPTNLNIENKDLEQLFDFVLPVIKKYSYLRKEELVRLEELNDKRRFSLKHLFSALLVNNRQVFKDFANKYDISSLLLEMVTELIAVPYFELSAEFFAKKLSKFHWHEPFCPICGSQPAMAKINEQNHSKILWCRRCNATWQFYDKICPFCLNDQIESQKFIFLSNRKPYRIEACDKCNNYLKAVDNLIFFDPGNFSVINIATYYLDILAKYYGYQLNDYFRFYFEMS